MSNLAKLMFMALDITGNNYLSWVLDAEIHLDANGLCNTIKDGNQATTQEKAKAMIFLRHHLHEALKSEYLTVKDPIVLWKSLKDRYDHQRTVILPRAHDEWTHLRSQDFKSVSEYNSAMFRITSQLILCGEKITDTEMLEKTFSTFHASNVLLQQQYREKGFKKYCDLISCLLVAEQNNELLMKNHETRPNGTAPLPKANAATYNDQNKNYGRGHERGRGRERGCGGSQGSYPRVQYNKEKRQDQVKKSIHERTDEPTGGINNICYRCGMDNHWSCTCCIAKHLVDLYQQSLKKNDNEAEVNLIYVNDNVENLHGTKVYENAENPHGTKDPNDMTNLDYDDLLENE